MVKPFDEESVAKDISSSQKLSQDINPKQVKVDDSIKFATNSDAGKWLEKNGFILSSAEEIIELTNERGYSIQVLTTSSASEAASVAKRFSIDNDVKVYLSSVVVDGVVEKRYKILATFWTGLVSAEKLQELQERLKSYLVS